MHQDSLSADAASYVFGSFTLDSRFRRLLQHNSVVPLTTKAFDTLEVLVRSAGHTVTKDELLKLVWPGTFVQEETLAQNISTIRRALGDSTELPRYVLTVPREGYRFIAPVEIVHPRPNTHEPSSVGELAGRSRTGDHTTRLPRWLPQYSAGLASGLMLAAIAFVLWGLPRFRSPAIPAPVRTTFEVFEPDGARFSTAGGLLTISPDGRHLAFLASDANGQDNLWIRSLDSVESTPLSGTRDASQPFWSADSQAIAFFSGGSLRWVDISGGPVHTVSPVPWRGAFAGSWNHDGVILFAVNGNGLFRVNASGGSLTPVTVPGRGSCADCLWPSFLPDDGKRFLFTVVSSSDPGIYVGSLDGSAPVRLLETESSAYATGGYLLYVAAGALVARRFNSAPLQVGDDVVHVADHVWYNEGTSRAVFSVSQTGLLAYREPLPSRLQWISRTGAVISTGPEAVYYSLVVSRDGRVLTSELDRRLGTTDLWLHDAALAAATRLTFDPASDVRPRWSDDQSSVVFAHKGPPGWQIYEVTLEKPGAERPLLREPSQTAVAPIAWNGDVLQYGTIERGKPSHLWRVRPGHAERSALIGDTNSNGAEARLSPDGKWLAYTTNVADSRVPHTTLFLRPWHDSSAQWEIASAGSLPRWRSDGRELYFIAPDGRLMAQRMEDGRKIGSPSALCPTEALANSGVAGDAYDALPDGQRFLIKIPARRASIVVMSGWSSRLER